MVLDDALRRVFVTSMNVVIAEHPAAGAFWGTDHAPDHFGMALARRLSTEYPPQLADNWLATRVEQKAGFKMRAATRAWRQKDAHAYVSMSEQVGFPLALLNRQEIPHVVVAHNLITPFKRRLQATTGWLEWFDRIVVFSEVIAAYLTDEMGLPAERVHAVPHPTDHRFYSPDQDAVVDPCLVVAVGREHRDYETLIDAMRRLPGHRAVVVANSPWAKRIAAGEGTSTPPNVVFKPFLPASDLRRLLSQAAVVALPLQPGVVFGAGLNGLCEAHAMGRPVIATATPGLREHLDNEATLTVPPSDPEAFANTIGGLLADRHRAEQMGFEGRRLVESHHTNEQFADRLAEIIAEVRR